MSPDLERERLVLFNTGFAMWASWATAATAVVALALGLIAVPIAGANCPRDCISYPYLDTIDRFPRDYLWIYVAVLLVIAYLVFMVAIRAVFAAKGETLGLLAIALAVAATVVLTTTYFTQLSVVPASLAAGETEGIALITMYNPHGWFIAMEEVGYLLMSLSFVVAAVIISGSERLIRLVRWVFAAGFVVPVVMLVAYSLAYGLDRQDRFEVVVLSSDWLVLIINGVLLGLIMRNRLRTGSRSVPYTSGSGT